MVVDAMQLVKNTDDSVGGGGAPRGHWAQGSARTHRGLVDLRAEAPEWGERLPNS
jgi:hypothetical protein